MYKENLKLSYCLGCLSFDNDCSLQYIKINDGPLRSIIQVGEICLCYICKHLAKKTEQFLKNVQSNQTFLENIHNLTESILQATRSQSQLLCLTNTRLDPVEVGAKNSEEPIKFEVKDENGFLEQLDREFMDDNDFTDSVVKEEDDFPLKDLLVKNEFQNGHSIKSSKNLRNNKSEKKRKRHSKSKKVSVEENEECSKEDFPLSDLLKGDFDSEELQEESSETTKIKKTKHFSSKDDLFKTQLVYITREQCMEERAQMAQDKKYLNSTYKCHDCIKSFNFQESYEKHMKNHSESMGEYECDICRQRTSSKEKLLRHKKCHEVRYKCMECGLTRINRLTIREHYNAFHLKIHSYVCPHCPKTFKRQVSLRKHVAYSHKNRVRVKCQYCQKTYANKEVLKAHIIVRHPKEISAGEVLKRYVCQECGMAFKAPSQLRNHNIKHSHTRDYYCVECDKSFKTEAAFKQHVKIAAPHVNYMELPSHRKQFIYKNGGRTMRCSSGAARVHHSFCKQSCRPPTTILTTHMVHWLSCTHCDKRFAVRRDLERHTNRVHLNIRPFQCDKCDRAYVNNWSLNEHKRFVHEGEKRPLKYPCSLCDKVFDRNQTLKAHVRTHTGEKPFGCARCPARFAQSGARATHLRLVHLRLPRARRPHPA